MSKDLWNDEPFRDGQQEFSNGQWKDAETYSPVPETTIRAARELQKQQAAQAAVVEDEEYDVDQLTEQVSNEDDDDDFTEVLSDARLRLEQGRLYEMVIQHNLFNDLDADPRAIKSVQNQIRKFARERMEIMLGIRQEQTVANNATVMSPFNGLEVDILKKLASAASKGATDTEEANATEPVLASVQAPKKKTLNSIGSQRTQPQSKVQPKPLAKKPEPIKRQARPAAKPLPPEFEPDYQPLDKPIHEMTAQELLERDQQAAERQRGRKAAPSKTDWIPQPDFQTQEMLALSQVSRAVGSPTKGNLSALIMANLKNSGKI